MFKTCRRILLTVAVAVLIFMTTGCMGIPEQPQIVSRSGDGAIRVAPGACSKTTAAENVTMMAGQALDPAGFSILNWNVYKGNREAWKQDFENFSSGQDIILLQEALLSEDFKDVLQAQGLNWHLNTAFFYDGYETGVMTASRLSAGHHCALRTAEPLILAPKTTLVSSYPLQGMSQRLLVANIHGINFSLGLESYQSQLQALEEILAEHDGPVVLAGDFNNWSEDRTRVLLEMIARLSLQQLPYRNHNRTLVLGNAIDHVFYRGLTSLNNHTWQVTSSDHNPITATFRVVETRLAKSTL